MGLWSELRGTSTYVLGGTVETSSGKMAWRRERGKVQVVSRRKMWSCYLNKVITILSLSTGKWRVEWQTLWRLTWFSSKAQTTTRYIVLGGKVRYLSKLRLASTRGS